MTLVLSFVYMFLYDDLLEFHIFNPNSLVGFCRMFS